MESNRVGRGTGLGQPLVIQRDDRERAVRVRYVARSGREMSVVARGYFRRSHSPDDDAASRG